MATEAYYGEQLGRRILAVGAFVITAMVGSAVYDSWQLHDQLEIINHRGLANLTRALANEADRNLQGVDVLLGDTANWYRDTGHTLTPSQIQDELSARVSGLPQVSLLTMVNAEGRQIFRSKETGEPFADVSDRPYFLQQRASPYQGLYVNEPIITRSERVAGLVLSRRLNATNGDFMGVIVAVVQLDTFNEMYSSLQLNEGSSLLLTMKDGTLVARVPMVPGPQMHLKFPEIPGYVGGKLVERTVSPVDGRTKLIVALPVGNHPLILAMTRDERLSMAPWHDAMVRSVVRTSLLSFMIILTILRLLHQLKKVRESMKARVELERRLQQNQRMESLGLLAGGIAHDFNNILGAILGFGEMARQKTQPGTDLHRYLDRVLQAGDRARLLVRHILDFSRSGVAECAPVHIQSVVEEALAMVTPTVPEGVVLKSELTAGNTAILGDATQLYQTVTNLCTNALQALGDTGTVTVRLYTQEVKEARMLAHGSLVQGSYVCLEVKDTGSGMTPEVVHNMFNPFFTTKKGNTGTGLGLSVVHGVVADHDGAVDVVSAPGKGTTMTLWLPSNGDFQGDREKLRSVPVQGHGQTIMVVDDEEALVELAEERLAYLGYEPVGFHTAEAALAAFNADPQRFDALLSDEMLPGMAGTELAEHIRAVRPGFPVFIMSGKVTPDLEERVQAVGADMLLRKPLQIGDIAEALSHLSDRGTP